jgi:hypothetical protein
MDTPEITLPTTVFLYGAGRSPATRMVRRQNRFKNRTPNIGDLSIRPNRRVAVTPEFVVKHWAQILECLDHGVLSVETIPGKPMTDYELGVLYGLVTRTPLPPAPAPEPAAEPAKAAEPVVDASAPAVASVEVLEPEEPEVDVAEPETERRWIPDGLDKLSKRELIALCAERGLTVEENRTTAPKLIELLRNWVKGS